jgi:hypothetical protein
MNNSDKLHLVKSEHQPSKPVIRSNIYAKYLAEQLGINEMTAIEIVKEMEEEEKD